MSRVKGWAQERGQDTRKWNVGQVKFHIQLRRGRKKDAAHVEDPHEDRNTHQPQKCQRLQQVGWLKAEEIGSSTNRRDTSTVGQNPHVGSQWVKSHSTTQVNAAAETSEKEPNGGRMAHTKGWPLVYSPRASTTINLRQMQISDHDEMQTTERWLSLSRTATARKGEQSHKICVGLRSGPPCSRVEIRGNRSRSEIRWRRLI